DHFLYATGDLWASLICIAFLWHTKRPDEKIASHQTWRSGIRFCNCPSFGAKSLGSSSLSFGLRISGLLISTFDKDLFG
ncbi:Transcription factor GTE8, partial [Zea mays]